MVPLLIKLALAPGLMTAATLTSARLGPRRGGVVSAFPAIVGPLLLVTTLEHGSAAAAQAASGTLLGLVSLAAFIGVYGRLAGHHGWRLSLGGGWLAAALASAAAGLGGGTAWWLGAAISSLALLLAWRSLRVRREAPVPRGGGLPGTAVSARGLVLRAAMTALLVTALSAAVGAFGATVGGLLAALPVLASLLAVFTHRQAGGAAAVEVLRGTLVGIAGFLAFCALVAATIVSVGPALAFLAATIAALLPQAAVGRLVSPRARSAVGPGLGRSAEPALDAPASEGSARGAAYPARA